MRFPVSMLVLPLAVACAGRPDTGTLAALRDVEPDMNEVRVDRGLDQAMTGYRRFLEEAPESRLTPEAMRRLADLKIEKEYGILGDGQLVELDAPQSRGDTAGGEALPQASGIADHTESAEAFERRAGGASELATAGEAPTLELPASAPPERPDGPLEAIVLYDRILADYPYYVHNDQVLYQKARAYDELGRVDEAIDVMAQLIEDHPTSRHIDEVQFRRAEYFFVRRRYLDAEGAYGAIAGRAGSDYYELARYKLGWTYYKQDMHEEALGEYVALLDHKVATGYDFEQTTDEADARRIADTYRVISLSFSYLGGPEAVGRYFAGSGQRQYEDRIYSHLGEFYLAKLRYHDAAAAYQAFVERYPLHRSSPHFGMRVAEIYDAGDFPKLVLEAKKAFAASYGLEAEYWRHFDVADAPDVIEYLEANLEDLASHYHALYQDESLEPEARSAAFAESLRWYRAYLSSFAADPDAPRLHHRMADLLLENGDFGDAALEYERVAYDYAENAHAADAGYAAIYAHREAEEAAEGAAAEKARSAAVESSLRFASGFPEHVHAAAVLSRAIDDLYAMQSYERAITTGRELLARYADAEPEIRRATWANIAHACFDTGRFPEAEQAYWAVLELTPDEAEARQAVVDNLAAAIYKQGEQAGAEDDHRGAADHFLRVAESAPTSEIRPLAEYDASAALIRIEDWAGAADVLETFRAGNSEHELAPEATRQLAHVHRQAGDLPQAAAEYERIAAEATEPALRGEALLEAGDLYETIGVQERARGVRLQYVAEFPEPLELAVETRFQVAQSFAEAGQEEQRREQLETIVAAERTAGAERTARVRYLAARSALVLAESLYTRFESVTLVQPLEVNLAEKQRLMDEALAAFGNLIDYEVAEVTAAATFYMAELYLGFGQSLLDSERPAGITDAERTAYETGLEEEAFPFEESGIEIHEKNRELVLAGVYNTWVERSLDRLALLVPGRYAKRETSSGFIRSTEAWAYRSPAAEQALAAQATEQEAGSAPVPVPAAQAEMPDGTRNFDAPEWDDPVEPIPEFDAEEVRDAQTY